MYIDDIDVQSPLITKTNESNYDSALFNDKRKELVTVSGM